MADHVRVQADGDLLQRGARRGDALLREIRDGSPGDGDAVLLYGSLATMFGSLCSSRLLGRFDRVTAFKWIIVAYSLISLLIFTPAEHIALIFALNILFLFVFNTTTPLQWLMALTWWITRRAAAGDASTGWCSPPTCSA